MSKAKEKKIVYCKTDEDGKPLKGEKLEDFVVSAKNVRIPGVNGGEPLEVGTPLSLGKGAAESLQGKIQGKPQWAQAQAGDAVKDAEIADLKSQIKALEEDAEKDDKKE